MRWLTRFAISVICLVFGASALFILAQEKAATGDAVKQAEVSPATKAPVQANQAALQSDVISSIRFAPAKPAHAMLNVETLVLRESAAANSRVVAKVKIDRSYYIDILDATDDALHVTLHLFSRGNSADESEKESVYVGWTDWASVEPNESMIVLDAKTGAVISRRPVGSIWSPVSYSPDGSRAMFNGPVNSDTKCEVRTSDYSIIRCIKTDIESTFFYGPSDGALYAAIRMIGGRYAYDTATWLEIVRIGDEGASNVAAEVPNDVEDLAISPDGRTGFYLHNVNYRNPDLKVDVVDLATFKIRNSFTLHGDNLPNTRTAFAVNEDGSELYADLESGVGKVSVIDTRTGETKRTLRFRHTSRESWYLNREDVIGDAVLLNIGIGGHDNPHPTSRYIWIKSDGRVTPEKRFSTVFQAGSLRYALDRYGKRIFKLDADNNVRESFKIDLSSLQKGPTVDLNIYTMSASPDGKRIILFVGRDDR
ncbi:MAG TPA: hypothetical protein VF779_18415 [Pyrinomonadaceae bacterium]